jgi:hypothetical protein
LFYYILPSTQFVNGINIPHVSPTPSFGLMGPDMYVLGFYTIAFFRYSPYTGHTLGVRGMCVLFVCPFVKYCFRKYIKLLYF